MLTNQLQISQRGFIEMKVCSLGLSLFTTSCLDLILDKRKGLFAGWSPPLVPGCKFFLSSQIAHVMRSEIFFNCFSWHQKKFNNNNKKSPLWIKLAVITNPFVLSCRQFYRRLICNEVFGGNVLLAAGGRRGLVPGLPLGKIWRNAKRFFIH